MTRTGRFAAVLAALTILGVVTTAANASQQHTSVLAIRQARDATWHWQSQMFAPRTRYAASAERTTSARYRAWVLHLWQQRAGRARWAAQHPPHLVAWLCIHRYEGSWTDPAAPYYGGLQMDYSFMSAYGSSLLRSKGTADHWTPLEQMWVAERAYQSGRGFYPWPTTARYCGLI